MSSATPGAPGRRARWSSADLVAGLSFLGFGLAFAWTAKDYDQGSAGNLGAGTFPLIVAVVLSVLGLAITVLAFVRPTMVAKATPVEGVAKATPVAVDDDPNAGAGEAKPAVWAGVAAEEEPRRFGAIPWRAIGFLSAAVVWFAFTLSGLGFPIASFGTVVLASYARPGTRWWQALAVAVGMAALCWLIFNEGLRMRLPLLGDWLGG